ncbi:MAG: vanadium-dependent haloperoxidase [Cyanobacteria bacterium J06600_6]
MSDRRQESYAIRLEAAELARSRQQPQQKANGDEQKYAGDLYFMSFTKGLPHNPDTGLLADPQDFVEFRRAIDEGFIDPFSDRVRHGAKFEFKSETSNVEEIDLKNAQEDHPSQNFRQWEAPTAGVAYELDGADTQAVSMPPAPPVLGVDGKINSELVFEMAEVYELAILRDVPFNDFETGKTNESLQGSLNRLNDLAYIKNQTGRSRKTVIDDNGDRQLDLQTIFRGSSPGVEVGPYLSQFLLLGNQDLNGKGSVAEGLITYGVLQIDQKVPVADPNKDFMIDMETYVKVQRGLNPDQFDNDLNKQTYVKEDENAENSRPARRFISTPRDLATYVHFDALYEAYLNACIILLGMKTPFDPGFDHLSGGGVAAENVNTRRNAGGFALYGGPHILNLVTEVSTRALKAVRFQKFNNHLRLRPEALAARIELLNDPLDTVKAQTPPGLARDIALLKEPLSATLSEIEKISNSTHFLPMAFAEGSPMHPAYGAGHATVAGACVTILKAFFDTSAVLVGDANNPNDAKFKRYEDSDQDRRIAFRAPTLPNPDKGEGVPAENLQSCTPDQFLTLEGELNKLAANISIGRNMAGVHFFTDYYDSLRMGEEIAITILEEQALTYSTDPFVLSLPTFDGEVVRIGRR